MSSEGLDLSQERKVVLEVQGLRTYFYTRRGVLKAVDDVSLTLREGETLGLVGESGSGKTMVCRSILRLVPQPAGRIVGGKILFDGEDLLQQTEAKMRKIRGGSICMILQDPMTSLNPVFTIGNQVAESIRIHQGLKGRSLSEKIKEALRLVGIPSAEEMMRQYPHQMSGGMRQRVVGAIAFACQPRLLIADEPTSSLDPPIQAQYLGLLKEIQKGSKVAMIFVTHNFGIVAKMCDQVSVMYAGRIVESAGVRELFFDPVHPYTIALLKSVPKLGSRVDELFSIEGQPPSSHNMPSGCSFAPRCNQSMKRCGQEYPPSIVIEPGRAVSCWLAQ